MPAALEGRRLAKGAVARLGAQAQQARRRRNWTQRQLGERVGLGESRVGQLERGLGGGVPLETWFALSAVLQLPLRLEFGRDALHEPTDAGHLKLQELMLRLGRQAGVQRFFELPTRSADPALSVDVGWRDDARRVLILNECWNTFGSINAAIRSTHPKIAEAEALATTGPASAPLRVAACWIVRDTRRNREIIARYPEVFASAFSASSAAWVRALTDPAAPVPTEVGLIWSDLKATRLFARRAPRSNAPR